MKYFLVFFIVLLFQSDLIYSQDDSLVYRFNTNNCDTLVSLKIINNSEYNINFWFTFNGYFFKNVKEILSFIDKTYHETTPYSICHFISENIFHQYSLNQSLLVYNPLYLVNSIGLGLCSQKANLMKDLCNESDNKTKTIDLLNHVICSSEIDNQKVIFDPDYHVMFKKKSSQIPLLLNELKSADLSQYRLNDSSFFRAYVMFYNNYYRQLYHNKSSIYETENVNLKDNSLTIPLKSTFTFPVSINDTSLTNINTAFARLTLPEHFKGSIRNPLLLYTIKGNCDITINNYMYFKIPENEKELIDFIKTYNNPIYVDVTNSNNAELYYFINNNFCKFKNQNKLVIYSDYPHLLSVELEPQIIKPVSFSFSKFNKYMPEIFKEVNRVKKEFPDLKTINFSNSKEIIEILKVIKLLHSKQEKDFLEKLNLLIKHSEISNYELHKSIEFIESFIAYSIVLKHLNKGEIITFAFYIKNGRKPK